MYGLRGSYEEIRFFDVLEMGLAAQVLLGDPPFLGEESDASGEYTERSVARDTLFTFNEGSEIYPLTSPAGRDYVMQSYSHIVDDTQTSDSLSELGSRLALPEGWTFTARVLEEDLFVEDVEGIATVVQDELTNTYKWSGVSVDGLGHFQRWLKAMGNQLGMAQGIEATAVGCLPKLIVVCPLLIIMRRWRSGLIRFDVLPNFGGTLDFGVAQVITGL